MVLLEIRVYGFKIETVSFLNFTPVTHYEELFSGPPLKCFHSAFLRDFSVVLAGQGLWHLFCSSISPNMKIAISVFGSKVSPRFDLSPELWIVTEKNGEVVRQERISLENFTISQRVEMLALTGAGKMICGGIHDFRLIQLRKMGIDVFYNVIGEADIALGNLLKGELRPGSVCEEKKKGNAVQARKNGGV